METIDYKAYESRRKSKAEQLARDYFYNQKQRKPYYWAEGNTLDDLDNHNEAFMHFTDEEVTRIKQLIIDTVNADQPDAEPVSTVQEAIDCLTYSEIFEQSEELRHLLQERCEQANLDPDTIDFDNPFYYYKFSYLGYDYDKNQTFGPQTVEVHLTDEDYIALLTLQLLERDNFCFNYLLNKDAELALRLNKGVEGEIYGYHFPVHVPFTILFDEIRSDAEVIGPFDEKKILL